MPSWLPSLLSILIASIAVAITFLSAQSAAKRSEVQNLADMLSQYRLENKEQAAEIERLQAKVDALLVSRDSDQKTIADLRSTVNAQAERITAMEAALTEGQKQIVDLQLTIAEQERQLARRDQTIARQAARIEDLEASKSELEARVAILEKENAELKARRLRPDNAT